MIQGVVFALTLSLWLLIESGLGAGGQVLFVAGPSRGGPGHHEHFADASLLAGLVARVPGLGPRVTRDWPEDASLTSARTLVLLCDAGSDHLLAQPQRLAAVDRLVRAGKGLVVIHSALQTPDEAGERMLNWVGARYDRQVSSSGRPGWVAGFHDFPAHPVARGLVPFSVEEQWYFGLQFTPGLRGIVPVLADTPPPYLLNGRPPVSAVLAWTYERPDGGRSFVVTAPHEHDSWGDESLRRVAINGIVWASGLPVPAGGTLVTIGPQELRRSLLNRATVYQDDEPPRPRKPPATAPAEIADGSVPRAVAAHALSGARGTRPSSAGSAVFRRKLPGARR